MNIQIVLTEEWEDKASTKIYSDRSKLKGCIGAAAVMLQTQPGGQQPIQQSLQQYLGTEDEQTVYIAEQAEKLISLELMWRAEKGSIKQASLFVDSQASLKVLHSNKLVSRHQLVDVVHSAYIRVMEKHPCTCITFRWVAVHKDCAGNKEADYLAKLTSSSNTRLVSRGPAKDAQRHTALEKISAGDGYDEDLQKAGDNGPPDIDTVGVLGKD